MHFLLFFVANTGHFINLALMADFFDVGRWPTVVQSYSVAVLRS